MQTREDDYRRRAAALVAMPDEPGKAVLELFAMVEEAKKALKAMTEHAADLQIENMRQSARIVTLLQSNNEFEERARRAERLVKGAKETADLLEMAHDLYTSVKTYLDGREEPLAMELQNYADAREDLARALLKPRA